MCPLMNKVTRHISKQESHNKQGKISIFDVVLGAPDRVNLSCLTHGTRLCKLAQNKIDGNSKPVIRLAQAYIM